MSEPKRVVLNVDDNEAGRYAVTRILRRIGAEKIPEEAISRQETAAVPHQTHGLKGACANIAAVALREDATEIELVGEGSHLLRASSLFGSRQQDFSDFRSITSRERLGR